MTRTAIDWLAAVQLQVLRGDIASAQAALAQALVEHPGSAELRRACAGLYQQAGRNAEAEALLRELLATTPGDAASAFILARILIEQSRTASAASVLSACFADAANCHDTDLAINAIELLDDCNCKADAAAIARNAVDTCPADARLHAYAGMLEIQLGNFVQARQHYLFALEHDERAWEWHVPIGLSATQRYMDAAQADFTLFNGGLTREGLSGKAHAELHFALGKMHDDIGDYASATRHFRAGNAAAHRLTRWSRKTWRRAIEARLATEPFDQRLEPLAGFTPVFIVGMPRSGTTLLAELLSRHSGVRNRGELPWVARLAEQPALSGAPTHGALQHAATAYAMHARQDDAPGVRWFIDKQPLNFRYTDLVLSMFPDARVIHCQRNERDTALSLWMQCFLEDVQGYSYDFSDIALVMRDEHRLMTHWKQRYADSIKTIRYEELVSTPDQATQALAEWVGLSPQPAHASMPESKSSINTASLWQARQPVNTQSVGRWQYYASNVPELLRFAER